MGSFAQSLPNLYIMSDADVSKKSGELALVGVNTLVPKLFDKIKKALGDKKLSFVKVIKIYGVIESAVKQVEAIIAEK